MAYVSRRDKGRLRHSTHEQVTDPPGVFSVSLVPFLWLCVFRVGKFDIACLFEDVEDRDPVLACRFHADISTLMLRQPFRQAEESFCKGREPLFEVFSTSVCISNANTGIDPGLVDIEPTTVFTDDLKWQLKTS